MENIHPMMRSILSASHWIYPITMNNNGKLPEEDIIGMREEDEKPSEDVKNVTRHGGN